MGNKHSKNLQGKNDQAEFKNRIIDQMGQESKKYLEEYMNLKPFIPLHNNYKPVVKEECYEKYFQTEEQIKELKLSFNINEEDGHELIQQLENDIKIQRVYSNVQSQPFWLKSFEKNEKNKNLFYNELQILNNLSHPNIIVIKDYFQDSQYYYIVYQNFPGIPIFQYFQKMCEKVQYDQIKQFMQDILNTVKYMHMKKITHRNLTPDNIYYDGQNILICNFEKAQFYETTVVNQEQNKKKSNKKSYLQFKDIYIPKFLYPPEFSDKKKYSYHIDVWLIGILFLIFYNEKPKDVSSSVFKKKLELIELYSKKENWKSLSQREQDIKNLSKKNLKKKKYQLECFKNFNLSSMNQLINNLLSNLLEKKESKRLNLIDFQTTAIFKQRRKIQEDQILQASALVSNFLKQKQYLNPIKKFYVERCMNYQYQNNLANITFCVDLDENGIVDCKEFMIGVKFASPTTSVKKDKNDKGYIEFIDFCVGFISDSYILQKKQLEVIYEFLIMHSSFPLTSKSIKNLLRLNEEDDEQICYKLQKRQSIELNDFISLWR